MMTTKKQPEPAPVPKKKSPTKRKAPRYSAPITEVETEFALYILRGTGDPDDTDTARIQYAARMCGLSEDQGRRAFARKQVTAFMLAHKRREGEILAQMEVRSLRKKGIGKAEVLAHLDRLAAIDPERTKGNIDGQVKAAQAAATILGLNVAPRDPDKFFEGRTTEEMAYYAMHGKFQKTIQGDTLQ
jgi:hypothetical protein